nr:hypothetical protein Itr_chr12CG23520 [Ipomoea trifida]GMD73587.1 hypothetical protein Iba_chr12fCG19820 [Ipomoea batatas]
MRILGVPNGESAQCILNFRRKTFIQTEISVCRTAILKYMIIRTSRTTKATIRPTIPMNVATPFKRT